MSTYGGDLVREARRRANLTQTELAKRAETSQPAIARWESGRTAISLDDVRRLVALCGFDLEVALVPGDDNDLAQAARLANLSGEQRLDRNARVSRQLAALRQAN
jgi:transcriptional regulator with XRE-family HTH domain